MSKRNLVLVVMALLFALSSTVYTSLVETPTTPAPDEGQTLARLITFGEPVSPLRDPTCPDPSNPGCGGG